MLWPGRACHFPAYAPAFPWIAQTRPKNLPLVIYGGHYNDGTFLDHRKGLRKGFSENARRPLAFDCLDLDGWQDLVQAVEDFVGYVQFLCDPERLVLPQHNLQIAFGREPADDRT